MNQPSPPIPAQPINPPSDAVRNALARQAEKANRRRFTGEPMTGFGGLA